MTSCRAAATSWCSNQRCHRNVPASCPSAIHGWCLPNFRPVCVRPASSFRCAVTSCVPRLTTTTATRISIACSKPCRSDLLAAGQAGARAGLERAIVGTLVLVLGVALLTNSRGVVSLVRQWVSELDVNPERRVIPRILSTVLRPIGQFSTRTVLLTGIGALLFAALELTEAVGLARRRRWAEYLTVIAGCIGIPLEVEEVLRRQTPVRISILLINVAIVIYLAWQKHLFGLRGGVATETERS
ncbi:MAG: DUF2127 domain-containing protein [Chloroflexi bacterium]|nr:MAG: DUF2127 domain-containing protein [Chloroflexota bacterium]